MSPSRILRAGLVAAACVASVNATTGYSYQLADEDHLSGTKLTDAFNYFTDGDPTNGFVKYVADSSLVDTSAGTVRINVDTTNDIGTSATGRKAIRLQSKKIYNHGLFIADFKHLPEQACGLWPAFWTSNLDKPFPEGGEIDMIENIHMATGSIEVLHATYPFSIGGQKSQMTGQLITTACDNDHSGNQGCKGLNTDTTSSYGKGFNDAQGGVYAMEWTSDVIRIWSWTRSNIPKDITSGAPVPSSWGLPTFSTAGGNGDIDSHFMDHRIVINTDFCGDWAGQKGIWDDGTASSCASKTGYSTCNDYVRNNGQAFAKSYWEINSIKVYNSLPNPVSSTSTTQSSTTSTSSTSSSSSTSTTPTPTPTPTTTPVVSSTPTPTPSTSSTPTPSVVSSSTTSTPTPTDASTTSSVTPTSPASTSTPVDSSISVTTPGSVDSTSTPAGSSTSTPTPGSVDSTSTPTGAATTTSATSVTTDGTLTPSTTPTTTYTTSTVRSTDVQTISGVVTTVVVDLYTTICPVSATSTSAAVTTSLTTSTVQATSTLTGSSGELTTVIVDLYTTICPVSATATSAAVSTSLTTSTVQATSTLTGPSGELTTVIVDLYTTICPVSAATTSTSVASLTTSTVQATSTLTGSSGQLTTVIVDLYTTICPVSAAGSSTTTKVTTATTSTTVSNAIATTTICPGCTTSTVFQTSTSTTYKTISYVSSPSASPVNYANSTTTPVVVVVTQSLIPVPVKVSNATSTYAPISTGGVTKILTSTKGVASSTSAGVVVPPTATPSTFVSNANRVGGGSVLALILVGAAAMFL